MCQWPSADGSRDAIVGVLVTNGRYTDFDQFAADYERASASLLM